MKQDYQIFTAKGFGTILMYLGAVLIVIFLLSGKNSGIFFGAGIVIFGKYLNFKANRRHGTVFYDGGKI